VIWQVRSFLLLAWRDFTGLGSETERSPRSTSGPPGASRRRSGRPTIGRRRRFVGRSISATLRLLIALLRTIDSGAVGMDAIHFLLLLGRHIRELVASLLMLLLELNFFLSHLRQGAFARFEEAVDSLGTSR